MSEVVKEPSRAEVLKGLRAKHEQSVERTRDLLKEQQQIRRAIGAVLKDEAMTIPATAEATGLPSEVVLWNVMAMKKYGLIEEMGMDGDYYTYQLVKES